MTGGGVVTAARAGFLHRLSALIIDVVLLCIPLQIAVMLLFAQTDGALQGSIGFGSKTCQPVATPPQSLDPPIPTDFTSIVECRKSLFGFDMERTLVVSKTSGDVITTTAYLEYYLDADGKQADAWSLDGIAMLVVLAYFVVTESWWGATFGKRFIFIRTVPRDDPARVGIPLLSAVVRQLVLWAPTFLILLLTEFVWSPDWPLDATAILTFVVVCWLVTVGWFLWIAIQAARKRDPIHDRMARTATLRLPLPDLATPLPTR